MSSVLLGFWIRSQASVRPKRNALWLRMCTSALISVQMDGDQRIVLAKPSVFLVLTTVRSVSVRLALNATLAMPFKWELVWPVKKMSTH